jgi:hypothetical protein
MQHGGRDILRSWLRLILVVAVWPAAAQEARLSGQDDSSLAVETVWLDLKNLNESSGLAVSRRRSDHFWTHNDSGGKPHLYAFDSRGRASGRLELESTEMVDWEDMASFTDEGVPRLLIADCGDNDADRSKITLHLLDEPDPRKVSVQAVSQSLVVVYADGPRDCEAIAVDLHRRQIILVAKSFLPAAGVYVLPLPDRNLEATRATVTATRVATLSIPMVTAMDIDQINGDLWVVSYFQAFQFPSVGRSAPLAEQVAQLPRPYPTPRWKQIESIAIDQTHDVWLTSEGSPAPLGRLPQSDQRSTQDRLLTHP